MQEAIKEYYNNLAGEYDADRFGNTYGKYIDRQEKNIIRKLLKGNNKHATLDMACGTGRFLEFADYGIDASSRMLTVARNKHPRCMLFEESVLDTHFEDKTFQTILSFHLVMHLTKDETRKLLSEAHRITQDGGRFIFDFPSKPRRKLVNYNAKNWHASNDIDISELQQMAKGWKLTQYYGILFFPIHRFPSAIRKVFIALDNLLCKSFLKKYASYLIVVLEKQR